LEFKREVYDYWKCNIQGMFEDKEDEQVYMVQNHKMKMLQREKCHEKQEKGSYCYIDFLEEDEMEAAKLQDEKGKEEPLVEDNKDDPMREEDTEDKKVEESPVKQEDDDNVSNGVNKIDKEEKESATVELEGNKTGEAIKNEERCQTWEEKTIKMIQLGRKNQKMKRLKSFQ